MALDRTRRLRTSSACAAEAAFAADPKRLRSKSASADVPTTVAGRVHFSRTRSHTSFTSDAHNVELDVELELLASNGE
jgi:hypothetical protein